MVQDSYIQHIIEIAACVVAIFGLFFCWDFGVFEHINLKTNKNKK